MFTDATLQQLADKYHAALAASMEIDVAGFSRVETVVRVEQERAGSGMAVAYHVGAPTVIRTDPALADAIDRLANPSRALSAEDFRIWAESRDWQFIDGGDQHLVSRPDLQMRSLPSGAEIRRLERENAADHRLIADLFARSDPDDVEEAEFELDDLDPFILGLIDREGDLRSIVSGCVWDEDGDFDDIGVLTDESVRGQGWGSAVVSSFCIASFDRGRIPLYRCNWSRTASKALAMGLGFQLMGQVSATGPIQSDD